MVNKIPLLTTVPVITLTVMNFLAWVLLRNRLIPIGSGWGYRLNPQIMRK